MLQKLVAFFTALLAFFSGLFAFLRPKKPEQTSVSGFSVSDVAYGSHARNVMDVAFPDDADGVVGLVLMIHGGAWIYGSKESAYGSMEAVTAQGYAAARISYRYVSADTHMDALMDDVQASLDKVAALAESHGFRVSGAMLTGVSAGAHMSLLYGYTRANDAAIPVRAIVSYCGPTDLTDPTYIEHNALGDLNNMIALNDWCSGTTIFPDDYNAKNAVYDRWNASLREISPLYRVTKDAPPTILAHGAQDTIVPYQTAVKLDARLTELGVKHDFVTYPNSGHGLEEADCAQRVLALLLQYAKAYL